MSHCCHGSPGSKKGDRHLKWWGIGGFALIVVLLWAFNGNPLVSQVAPAILLGLLLTWLTITAVRKMGNHY